MAKVKKRAGVTGVRNAKAKKANGRARASSAKRPAAKVAAPKAAAAKNRVSGKTRVSSGRSVGHARSAKAGVKGWKGSAAAKAAAAADRPVERVVIRELDPQEKCGGGTSVQFLYRVDRTVDGERTAHLVFFDPHGWYCEHGRTCPAVAHAKKHNGQLARVS